MTNLWPTSHVTQTRETASSSVAIPSRTSDASSCAVYKNNLEPSFSEEDGLKSRFPSRMGDRMGDRERGPMYKTRMCKSFLGQGRCPKGPECGFAHGSGELRSLPGERPRNGGGGDRYGDRGGPRGPRFDDRRGTCGQSLRWPVSSMFLPCRR